MLNNARKTLCYSRLSLFLLIVAGFIFTPTIYSQEVNVALGKPATQRSNIGGGYGPTEGLAALAVDGNTNGNWNGKSVTHTAVGRSLDPWWEVDLGADYNVNKIQIWNRTDCCSQELSNYRIWTKSANGGWVEFSPGLKTYTPGETNPRIFTGSKQARHVRVIIGSPSATLMLAEVKVFGTPVAPTQGVNLALGKPATQSINMGGGFGPTEGLAALAVDGNTNGDWKGRSVTHTAVAGSANPWWSVDMGAVYNVNKIEIWNRTDCCQERLSNFRIMVIGPSGGWEEFTPGLKTYTDYPLTITGSKRTREVMVQIMGPNATLMLAEVKVFGTPVAPTQGVNLALGKRATQSSNIGGGFGPTEGLAALAVDGNTNGDWKGRSVTHTAVAGSANPWWSVDLGAVYNVNKIEIWNRTDCCQERLSNFRIMVIGTSGNFWEEFTPGLKTYTDYPLTITGSKRTRGVMVQIMGPNATLMLAEVKVFGTP